jgi:hypothetical protein
MLVLMGRQMKRRDFVKAIIGSAAGWPLLARAQQRTTPVSPLLGQPTMDGIIVEELFGVSHPDQILMLPAVLNPATQKLMKGGIEVPYQVDGSKILVRAEGGVAANSSHVWMLASGARSAPAQVSVIDGGTYWQIDNTLTAVRIPKSIPLPTPAICIDEWYLYAPSQILAPIQGIRHRDGTWTGFGPNYLYCNSVRHFTLYPDPDGTHTFPLGSTNFPVTSTPTVEVLETGPLRAKIKLTYPAVRPLFGNSMQYVGDPPYRNWTAYNPNSWYICTISMQAGQPCIKIEEDTDSHPAWHMNMNVGVNANRGRYRGWGLYAGTDPSYGHNYDGSMYQSQDSRPETDAEINFSDTGRRNGWDYTNIGEVQDWDGVVYPRIYIWFTWETGTGWYWYAFNSAGSPNSNIWGIFQDRASTTRGAMVNAGLYGKPAAGTPTELGFYTFYRPGFDMDNSVPPYAEFQKTTFNIFLGSKVPDVPVQFSDYYWLSAGGGSQGAYATYNPGISKYCNIHGGVAQLWKQVDLKLDYPDPPGGFPGMYLSVTDTAALINACANDETFHQTIRTADPNYASLYDAFADATNVQANSILQQNLDVVKAAIDIYVNRANHLCLYWAYCGRYTISKGTGQYICNDFTQ